MIICYVLRESRSLIRLCFVEVIHEPEYRFRGKNSKLCKVTAVTELLRCSSVMFIMIYCRVKSNSHIFASLGTPSTKPFDV